MYICCSSSSSSRRRRRSSSYGLLINPVDEVDSVSRDVHYNTSALLALRTAVLARPFPSVCPSVTFLYCVQMNEDMLMWFLASGTTVF